ncbi:MAG: hypothetical protein NZ700_02015, partial [Gemmataceae bacterium]|nr:hypothetical protein [Gemmataceae bacterium]MDW8265393.1 hypothetical protein [Gemmataceae bacterium]
MRAGSAKGEMGGARRGAAAGQWPAADWAAELRRTLARYDESLLRTMADRLVKPRNYWPVEELIERSIATVENVPVIDRRLRDLELAERHALAVIGHSGRASWPISQLVEVLAALGAPDGLAAVRALFEAGLLFPDLGTGPETASNGRTVLRSFDHWLGQGSTSGLRVWSPPAITRRAVGIDLGLPRLRTELAAAPRAILEADGLEWPLRLAVVWQLAANSPFRRTQQGDLFKRDLDRLRGDPLLATPLPEALAPLPDLSLCLVAWANQLGILAENDHEWRAGTLPSVWSEGLWPALASLWQGLVRVTEWQPLDGWRGGEATPNPFPTAQFLALLLLTTLDPDDWACPEEVARWVVGHHPFWKGTEGSDRAAAAIVCWLGGLAYPLRLVQATRPVPDRWLVRLSPLGRWLLGGGGGPPP